MTARSFTRFKKSKKAKKSDKRDKSAKKIEKYTKIDVAELNQIILAYLLTFISSHIIEESIRECLFRQFGSKEFLQALTNQDVQTFRFKAKSLNNVINSFIQVFKLFSRYEIGYLDYAPRRDEKDASDGEDASERTRAVPDGYIRVPYIQKNYCVISTTGLIVYSIKSNTVEKEIKFCNPFALKVDPNNCVTFH